MKGDSPIGSCWDSVCRMTKINPLMQTHPLFSVDRPYAEDEPPEWGSFKSLFSRSFARGMKPVLGQSRESRHFDLQFFLLNYFLTVNKFRKKCRHQIIVILLLIIACNKSQIHTDLFEKVSWKMPFTQHVHWNNIVFDSTEHLWRSGIQWQSVMFS